MQRSSFTSPSAVALVALVACASSSDGAAGEAFPAAAYTAATSDSGALVIEARTSPSQPPPRGTCNIQLTVKDARDGRPMTALAVGVVPWMAAHAHGTSITPTVRDTGDGHYVASDVSLYMPGEWDLRVSIAGSLTDHAVLHVDVP